MSPGRLERADKNIGFSMDPTPPATIALFWREAGVWDDIMDALAAAHDAAVRWRTIAASFSSHFVNAKKLISPAVDGDLATPVVWQQSLLSKNGHRVDVGPFCRLTSPTARRADSEPQPINQKDCFMLFVISGLKGAAVESSEGPVGTAKDFLFDDETWRIRWMVVDTGTWLPGRKVLVHPSAIAPLDVAPPPGHGLQMMSMRKLALSVRLTARQIEASPDISEDEPVSKRMENHLYDYYGWDPSWGTSYFGTNAIATPLSRQPFPAASSVPEVADMETHPSDGDPHLRSATAVNGYHIHATDGDIGHVENFLADDVNWDIRYLVIATSNWWPGKHVLLAPYAIQDIDWPERHIRLSVTRDQVKSSPPWDPVAMVDRITEQRLHNHYGWPGYGW